MADNPKIRKSFEEFINAPLSNPGTDSFIIRDMPTSENNVVFIDKESAQSFVKLSIQETKKTEVIEVIVKFVAANVNNSSGWKAEINNKEEIVRMDDELFRERLHNMEEPNIFGRSFNVALEKITTTKFGNDSAKFSIKKVHHESSR